MSIVYAGETVNPDFRSSGGACVRPIPRHALIPVHSVRETPAAVRSIGPKGQVLRTMKWRVEWVEDMPESMEPGRFYISIKHRLTEHYCACGCGTEVSLPLGGSGWKLMYDGDSIDIWPSVGNWRLPCKSHYLIMESKTIWCDRWSEEEILKGRERDRALTLADVKRKNWHASWFGRLFAKIGLRR